MGKRSAFGNWEVGREVAGAAGRRRRFACRCTWRRGPGRRQAMPIFSFVQRSCGSRSTIGALDHNRSRQVASRATRNRAQRRRDRSVSGAASRLGARRNRDRGRVARGVTMDAAESPLVWLARRKGRDGQRPDRAGPVPGRRTSARGFHPGPDDAARHGELVSSVAQDRRAAAMYDLHGSGGCGAPTRAAGASKRSGRNSSVFCSMSVASSRGLRTCERERGWPPRSAKVVLQLASRPARAPLRLRRRSARSWTRAPVRTWLAPDATFVLGE